MFNHLRGFFGGQFLIRQQIFQGLVGFRDEGPLFERWFALRQINHQPLHRLLLGDLFLGHTKYLHHQPGLTDQNLFAIHAGSGEQNQPGDLGICGGNHGYDQSAFAMSAEYDLVGTNARMLSQKRYECCRIAGEVDGRCGREIAL